MSAGTKDNAGVRKLFVGTVLRVCPRRRRPADRRSEQREAEPGFFSPLVAAKGPIHRTTPPNSFHSPNTILSVPVLAIPVLLVPIWLSRGFRFRSLAAKSTTFPARLFSRRRTTRRRLQKILPTTTNAGSRKQLASVPLRSWTMSERHPCTHLLIRRLRWATESSSN
jgi:hypothetical protein